MKARIRFGAPMPEYRTDYGTLRTKELEKIIGFINKRGILIATCFDRKIIVIHPSLVSNIWEQMIRIGFQPLLIGATVSNLRKKENLNLAQNRVLEALTPGALIVQRTDKDNLNMVSLAIPDSCDLRDICSSYDGVLQGFITASNMDENELIEVLGELNLEGVNTKEIGILEYPFFDENPTNRIATVTLIYEPNKIKIVKEGIYDFETVRQASDGVSQYEMGEWT